MKKAYYGYVWREDWREMRVRCGTGKIAMGIVQRKSVDDPAVEKTERSKDMRWGA